MTIHNNNNTTRLTFSLLSWWLGLLLITLSFVIPVLSGPWPTFYKEVFVILGLGALSISALPSRISKSSIFLGALVLVIAFQYAFGLIIFPDDAIIPIGYLIALALSIEIGREINTESPDNQTNIQNKSKQTSLWVSILFAGGCSAIIAVRQWTGSTPTDFELPLVNSRPYANIGQANLLNDLIFLALCSTLYLYNNKRIHGILAWSFSSFLLITISIIQSRTPWLVLSFSTLFISLVIWKKATPLSFSSLATLLIVFISSTFFVMHTPSDFGDGILDISARATSGNREGIWKLFLDAIKNGEWHGYGWNQTVLAQISSDLISPQAGRFDYAHSIILDSIIWTGPFLGVLFLTIACIWLARQLLSARAFSTPAATLAICGLGIHALLEYPHAYLFFLVPFGIILGIFSSPKASRSSHSAINCWLWVTLTFILSVSALISAFDYGLVEQSETNLKLKRANLANIEEIDLSQALMLNLLIEEQEQRRQPAENMLSEEQLKKLRKITYRRPTMANLARLAMNDWRNNNQKHTCQTLELIQKIYGKGQREAATTFLHEVSNSTPVCKTPAVE